MIRLNPHLRHAPLSEWVSSIRSQLLRVVDTTRDSSMASEFLSLADQFRLVTNNSEFYEASRALGAVCREHEVVLAYD